MSVVALGVEGLAGGGGPGEPAVVGRVEGPAGAVGDAVVVPTEGDEPVEVGGAAVAPQVEVVDVAPRDGEVAAGEGATAVTEGDRFALGVGREPFGAAHVEGDTEVVHHDGDECAVAGEESEGAVWEDDAVTGADPGSFGEQPVDLRRGSQPERVAPQDRLAGFGRFVRPARPAGFGRFGRFVRPARPAGFGRFVRPARLGWVARLSVRVVAVIVGAAMPAATRVVVGDGVTGGDDQ